MPEYSEQDLKHAAEFREEIHRQALERLRQIDPGITEVTDRYPVEAFFEDNWEYPGRWYTYVAIPPEAGGRARLIDTIVKDTLSRRRGEETLPDNAPEETCQLSGKKLDVKHYDYEKLFTVSVHQESRTLTMVGRDAQGRYILEHYEEYSLGSATGSVSEYYVLTETEFKRYAKQALVNCNLTQEEYARLCLPEESPAPAEETLPEAAPFSTLYADYPDAVGDIYIVKDDRPCRGLASHRRALAVVCRALSVPDEDGWAFHFDLDSAQGWPVSSDAPFVPLPCAAPNLRKAVLDPPHGCHYDEAAFDALCAALFPQGRSRLEVFEWSTDWSDYFDDGHEWWGSMCYTVYDRSLDRYVVLMASETD